MGTQNLWPWNNPKGFRSSSQTNLAYNTDAAINAHVLTAAKLTGGFVEVDLSMTGTLAGAQTATTDTAANIVAAIPQGQRYIGFTYKLCILNQSPGAFTWTVAGGTGVTITGTATVAQNTCREFLVTLSSLTAVTLQNIGSGTV